ncbi:MAG: hypothetical protein AB7F19_07255 [Candidatus Babeliales bacterium]
MKNKLLITLISFIFLQTHITNAMDAPGQRIAILAFGSLVENPGNLPLKERDGFKSNGQQGPGMRIEYARKSNDGRLTLVVAPGINARELKSYFATFNGNNVNDAIAALREREGTIADNIGYINLLNRTYRRKDFNGNTGAIEVKKGQIGDNYYQQNPMLQRIMAWAQAHNYTAVIWTDLPPTFTKTTFNRNALQEHLAHLDLLALLKSYCYFKITPDEIRNGTQFGNDLINFSAGILRARAPEVAEILRGKGIRNNFENLTNADCIKIIWG